MCDNRDHINSLEVEISKLSNRCEVSWQTVWGLRGIRSWNLCRC